MATATFTHCRRNIHWSKFFRLAVGISHLAEWPHTHSPSQHIDLWTHISWEALVSEGKNFALAKFALAKTKTEKQNNNKNKKTSEQTT